MKTDLRPADLSTPLLAWYDLNRRRLPWRALPGDAPDAYRVWLSEIMLQQTTVRAVEGYFLAFTRRWPTIADLAAASLDDVLRAWAGLGYYARARNLHRCARDIVARHGGRFPETLEGLERLPGVGPYTAAAIAAIVFGVPVAAVDGNVERVVSRLFAVTRTLPAAKPDIRAAAASLVPAERPGDHAQAMMDLGALVCTPRAPGCRCCPLADGCLARRTGIETTLPRKAPRLERPVRYGTAFWAGSRDGAVLMRRRPERGLLGGMMEFPSTDWLADAPDPAPSVPLPLDWRPVGARVEHTFTHFHLVLEIWWAECEAAAVAPPFRWVPRRDLAGEALPSVMRKVAAAVLGPAVKRTRPSPAGSSRPRTGRGRATSASTARASARR
jgi:A/G-specific adenine glycosylase